MRSLRRDEQPRLLGFEQPAPGGTQAAPRPAGGRKIGREASGPTPAAGQNSDLVGRGFRDRDERVVVTEVSRANPAHVVVRRERDGHTWTIPAGIVRMILPPARRRAA